MVSDDDDIIILSSPQKLNPSTVDPYECKECGKTFKHKISWVGHQGRHQAGRKATEYPCDHCEVVLHSADELIIHKVMKHENEYKKELPYSCQYCARRFKDHYRSRAHVKTHTDLLEKFKQSDDQYKCDECGEIVEKAIMFYLHLNSHPGYRMFVCEFCDSRFHTEATLNTHKRLHTKPKMFKCDECNAEFHRKINLQRHVAAHARHENMKQAVDGVFKCSFCVKVVFRSDKLEEHEAKHAAELNNFFCCICGSDFKDEAQMQLHESKHITSTGKIKCLSTSKSFNTPEELTEYYCNNQGAHRKFKCKVCLDDFARLHLLKDHQLIHDPQEIKDAESKDATFDPEYASRLFECDYCGRRFKRSCHLKVHKTIHQKELNMQGRQQELLVNFTNSLQPNAVGEKISTKEELGEDPFSQTINDQLAEEDPMTLVKEEDNVGTSGTDSFITSDESKNMFVDSEASSSAFMLNRKRTHADSTSSSSLVALVKEKVSKLLETSTPRQLQGYPCEEVKREEVPIGRGHSTDETLVKEEVQDYEQPLDLQAALRQMNDEEHVEENVSSINYESRVQHLFAPIEAVMRGRSDCENEVMLLWIQEFTESLYQALLESEQRCVVISSLKAYNNVDCSLYRGPVKKTTIKILRPDFYIQQLRLCTYGNVRILPNSSTGITIEAVEQAFAKLYKPAGLSMIHLVEYGPEDEIYSLLLSSLSGRVIVCNSPDQVEMPLMRVREPKEEIIDDVLD